MRAILLLPDMASICAATMPVAKFRLRVFEQFGKCGGGHGFLGFALIAMVFVAMGYRDISVTISVPPIQ